MRCQLETLESRRVLASWTQQQELLPGGIAANDDVGRAVAIEGDLAVVGSRREDLTGPNTNEGAVYVFRRSGSTWSQIAMLVASDGSPNDQFGHDVAIYNGTIVVSAIGDDVTFGDEGSVYVFEQTGPSTWVQTAHLLPVPDFVGQNTVGENFGESVAIDGNTIAIGARSDNDAAGVVTGSVYVFQDTGSGWTANPPRKIRASDGAAGDRFGFDVAIHVNRIVAGAPFDDTVANNDGSVYVFDRPANASPFAEVAKIVAGPDASLSDEFGTSVAVEGSNILVGARNEGGSGAAYVFTGGATVWSQQAKLLPTSGSLFGVSVDLQGDLAVVGATGGVNGRAFAFARTGTTWGPADLVAPDDSVVGDADVFGQSVAIDDGFIIVGAPLHDHTGPNSNSGAAYVFVDPNDPPVNAVPGPQTTNEDVPLEFSAANSNAINISDPDAFAADIEVTLEATNGTVTLGDAGLVTLLVGDGDGDTLVTFRGTVAEVNAALEGTQFLSLANYFGAASLKITTDDLGNTGTGGAMTDEDTISITVDSVNDVPTVANAIADVTVNEDAADTLLDLSATFDDVDIATNGDNLTLSVTGNTSSGLVSTAIAGNALTLSYAADQNGAATITVRATDTAGAYVETSFLVTVDPINDVPTVANAIANVTVNEDAADTVLDLSATFDDVDIATNGDSLTLSVAGNTNAGLVTTAIVGNSLSLSYAADQNGAATITVRATDTAGAYVETSFLVTVDAVNDAPAAIAQNLSVAEDGQVSINLSGADIETPTGNLTFTIVSLPATGSLTFGGVPVEVGDTFSGPPALVYEPAIGSGATSASFGFTVTDDGDDSALGQADETSAVATVTNNITPAVANGTATLVGGVLRVGGTNGNDAVLVSRSGSTWNVSINGVTTTFALATVTEIRIWGRDGNDTIVVDTNVSVPATIDAGNGNDIVTSGNGHDLIFGGAGIDLLFGNGGNDMVIGGEGADLISGGAGHDVVVAGSVAATFTAAMLRDVAAAWAADRTATEGVDDGTIDESAFDGDFDILSGGSGADWFIVNVGDWIIDYRPNGVNGDLITRI